MRDPSLMPPQIYVVDVRFFSGGEPFATESYRVSASSWFTAERHALELSADSAYDNPRIPGLTRQAAVRPDDGAAKPA